MRKLLFILLFIPTLSFGQEYPFGFEFGISIEEFKENLSESGEFEEDEQFMGKDGVYVFYPNLDDKTPICIIVHIEAEKTAQLGIKVGTLHEEDMIAYPGHLSVWGVMSEIKKKYPDNAHHLKHGGILYTLKKSEEIDDKILMSKI